MNKKIQSLYNEATKYADDAYKGDEFGGFVLFERNKIRDERFALLIVQACADAADMGAPATKYVGDYVMESMDFSCTDR